MNTAAHPSINQLPEFHSRPVDLSVAFSLLWLVGSAGSVDLHDNSVLNRHLQSLELEPSMIEQLIALAYQVDDDDLQEVFDVLNSELKAQEKEFLFDIAVAVSTKNQNINVAANHILRFFADFLDIPHSRLQEVYQQHHRMPLPKPEDLSSPVWWSAAEFRDTADSQIHLQLSREQALAILDLPEDATADDIKRVYRRKMQSHHPDRFEKLGEQAREAAESKFILVQRAYEVLKS